MLPGLPLIVVGKGQGYCHYKVLTIGIMPGYKLYLESIPFLISDDYGFQLRVFRTVVGTASDYSTTLFAAFPFVARLVESSLREVDGNIIETAVSMGQVDYLQGFDPEAFHR